MSVQGFLHGFLAGTGDLALSCACGDGETSSQQEVRRLVRATNVEITAIEEVVNSNMQSLYEAARTGEVRERNPQGCAEIQGISAWKCSTGKSGQVDLNEYLLFHGCPEGQIESTARSGFDPQMSGTAVGAMFGQGIYSAENASKSDLCTTFALCEPDATCLHCNHAHGMRKCKGWGHRPHGVHHF